jgi:hypothetical protein
VARIGSRRGLPLVALALSALLQPSAASAQVLYCCNIEGVRTCGDTLPPACFGRPYIVRGLGGKLLRSIEAPPTPEQLKEREEQERLKKEEAVRRKEQGRLDAALLATYSSEAEIERGRERMEAELAVSISAAEARIAAAEKRKNDAVGDPELYRKRGLPDDLKRQVQDIDFEIRTQKELLESKKRDLEAGRLKYAEDRQRYLDLKARRNLKR